MSTTPGICPGTNGARRKSETPERKAIRLRWLRDDCKWPLPAAEADWLDRYDAKIKALEEMAAKREARRQPTKKLAKICNVEPLRRAELIEAGGRIEAQLAQGESRALLFLRALAMTPVPRVAARERLIVKVARIGREAWIRTKFSVDEPGRRVLFGQDLLRLMALLTAMQRTGQVRFDFRNLQELWSMLAEAGIGARGGNSDKELGEAFRRLADTTIEIRAYHSEADARADRNYVTQTRLNFIKQCSLPSRKEPNCEAPFFEHYLEASRDLQDLIADRKNHVWVHEEILLRFSGDPLKLRFALLVVNRCQGTKVASEMSHEELMESFHEGDRQAYPERKLIKILQDALAELQILAGNGFKVKFLESKSHNGKRGRPASKWALRFDPGSRILTRKCVIKTHQ